MPIPEYPEPGVIPGEQQVLQQQSINFSSAIPLKKRRFPIFQEKSSSPEEKSPPPEENQDSKEKQDHKITDGGLSLSVARNSASPASSDVRKTSPITVKKEVTPTNIQLGEAIVDTFTSKALVVKPSTSLGPLDDLGNKKDIIQSGNSSEHGKVMQVIVSEKTAGTNRLELSLGPKEPLVSALKRHNSGSVIFKSENSDSSLLSLGLHDKKLVLNDKNDTIMNNDGNQVCANRSNWDLNTTMDVWEGSSTCGDAFAHRLVDTGGSSKTTSCHDDKSSLTTEGTVGLHLDKGKRILDGKIASSFSNVSTQPGQLCKNEDSLRLVLASPCMSTIREHPSLSDNAVPTTVSPYLTSKQVQLSINKVIRVVKSEPADDNSKRDCSVGSSSSSSMELLKFNSVKRELAINHSLETILQSTISPEKLVDCRLVKSEMVQEHNQEASKSDNVAIPQSARRVIQHQDSSASSSSMPLSLMHQNPFPSRLPTCSEVNTSGDLSNQSEGQSFHSKENEELRPWKVGDLSVEDSELTQDDEHKHELSKNNEVAANDDDDDMDISPERLEEGGLGSDSEPQQNIAVDAKEDEEYEDGEVREPIQLLAQEDSIPEDLKTESLKLVESDSRNFQLSVPLGDQSIQEDDVKKTQEETHSDSVKDELNSYHNSLPITSDKVVIDEKVFTPDKKHDFSRNDVQESPGKEVLVDVPNNGSHEVGVEQGDEATKKVVTGEDDLNLSKIEAPLDGHNSVKDSNNAGNKSRIINLSRASVVTSPCKPKSIPNRLLNARSGKERYTDLDGEMQPRGNRDEFYTGGSNKFVKGRVHDPSHRNSRPNFMLGKGRGRFGSLRGEWNSEHDFSSETSYGPSDYRVIRRKHNSSISDIDLDCNGYGVPQDGNRNRRKTMNDEFPSVRRTSLRRISSGDRDGPVATRGGVQMLHRIPRNMSPRRCSAEAGSDVIGLRHDDKFMRLSDDIGDQGYNRPQAMYDELDDQIVHRERNFSTMQRQGFPRIRSKSPGRSRTRSPGPWSSPRRRSPNGLPELTQHRSPPLYRMRRMRSPERACFREEMVSRRRGSPSFVNRHNNEMRDVDSGREHVHPRPNDSNRRSSPGRVFPRNGRRNDGLDSREIGDGDEYMNGPNVPHKFHGDGGIDERRKLFERRGGPLRSFRPNYNGENENFQFHMNDGGPRPYRFIPDAEAEFVERSNMREREFEGRMKHQPPLVRRIRNMEEQQDGNYRPVERGVWHEEGGFPDGRVKRRRF